MLKNCLRRSKACPFRDTKILLKIFDSSLDLKSFVSSTHWPFMFWCFVFEPSAQTRTPPPWSVCSAAFVFLWKRVLQNWHFKWIEYILASTILNSFRAVCSSIRKTSYLVYRISDSLCHCTLLGIARHNNWLLIVTLWVSHTTPRFWKMIKLLNCKVIVTLCAERPKGM